MPLFVVRTTMSKTPLYIDRRDEAVIEALIPGEVYGVTQIKKLYKLRTDIRNDRTAKDRKNALIETPAFECVGIGKFRYLGVDSDE